MSEHVKESTTENTVAAVPVETARREHRITVAERVIYWLGGILLGLLAIRFLLRLLGANPANGFADFIYTVTHPFVAPFFGLFNYQEQIGVGRFEYETLVAMVVYALVMYLLARLVAIPSRRAMVD